MIYYLAPPSLRYIKFEVNEQIKVYNCYNPSGHFAALDNDLDPYELIMIGRIIELEKQGATDPYILFHEKNSSYREEIIKKYKEELKENLEKAFSSLDDAPPFETLLGTALFILADTSELAKDFQVAKSTILSWSRGKHIPREHVQKFVVEKLLERIKK